MRYRQLDSSGDMTFGQSQNNFLVDSPAAVAQVVLTGLRLIFGEWYLNTTEGVPYFQGVLGRHSQATADLTIISAIQNFLNVTGVENYQSTVDSDRGYSATCLLNTAFGQTELQISNIGNF